MVSSLGWESCQSHFLSRIPSLGTFLSICRWRRAPLVMAFLIATGSRSSWSWSDVGAHGEGFLQRQDRRKQSSKENIGRETEGTTEPESFLKDIQKEDFRSQGELVSWYLTGSPAFGPSVWKSMGRQRLSSFIKLEFWKWAIRAAFPWIRAYASVATFSLLNFSHFLPLNACKRCNPFSLVYKWKYH